MVGDFGGGGMLLAFGVVCALLEAQRSGQGQVIDAAMVDGAAVLMTMFRAFRAVGMFDEDHRGTNLLDTGAHFYDVYRCADGKYISVGSIEPQFYAELLRHTGLQDDPEFASQMDKALWPVLKGRLEVHLPPEDPRRVVRDHGAHRRVLRARAHHERSRRPSPQPGPRHLRRGRRDRAAGARAPVQPHRPSPSSGRRPIRASTPVRCSPTGASRPPRSTSSFETGAVK